MIPSKAHLTGLGEHPFQRRAIFIVIRAQKDTQITVEREIEVGSHANGY